MPCSILISINSFLRSIINESTPQHILYITEIEGRWEGWTFICGEREHIATRKCKRELEAWAMREGWEVVEI